MHLPYMDSSNLLLARRAYQNFRRSKSGRKAVARYPFRLVVIKMVQKWQVRRKGKPVRQIFLDRPKFQYARRWIMAVILYSVVS